MVRAVNWPNVKLLSNENSIFFLARGWFHSIKLTDFPNEGDQVYFHFYINLCYNFENNQLSPEKIRQDYSYAFS